MWPSRFGQAATRRPEPREMAQGWLGNGSFVRDGLDGLAWKWTSPRQTWTDVVDFVLPQSQPNLGASAGLSSGTEGQVLVRQKGTSPGAGLSVSLGAPSPRCPVPRDQWRAGQARGLPFSASHPLQGPDD